MSAYHEFLIVDPEHLSFFSLDWCSGTASNRGPDHEEIFTVQVLNQKLCLEGVLFSLPGIFLIHRNQGDGWGK